MKFAHAPRLDNCGCGNQPNAEGTSSVTGKVGTNFCYWYSAIFNKQEYLEHHSFEAAIIQYMVNVERLAFVLKWSSNKFSLVDLIVKIFDLEKHQVEVAPNN